MEDVKKEKRTQGRKVTKGVKDTKKQGANKGCKETRRWHKRHRRQGHNKGCVNKVDKDTRPKM